MYWIIVFSLFFCSSSAQLTPANQAACEGEQVVFFCQQSGSNESRWTVAIGLPGIMLSLSVSSSQAGMIVTFADDPGFGFEIHIMASNLVSNVISELRVTAVRELNGVTVECAGGNERFMSTIELVSIAAPGGVMTTADQSQFTPSTASIPLTWSASSGADNYTIMVTPLLPSGQSLVSTNTTSLQLTVLYNEEYSINITAQNCAGSNSTIVSLTIVGCSPPSPLANGSISEYSSGAAGAMLTFQCDTGYMPQEEVTSTCLSNRSWVPTPECQVTDCGSPFAASGVIIDPFNDTKSGALITLHCEEDEVQSMTSLCSSNGEWIPDPNSFECGASYSTTNPPAAPSGVMTTADQRQFTPSTASITLTWSASSGADNYTIMVTPLLPSGQSLVSTTTTSLQLTVLYNEEYSINITAHNCAGSNSTIVPLTIVGCSPPSPLANGSISEYSSGAVGAMLTFQCDTGYMPQEEVASTCLSNSSWAPLPECQVTDCGAPFAASGVIIGPFNDTTFGAMITFHCEEDEVQLQPMTSLCSSNGEWIPDPNSLVCAGTPYSTTTTDLESTVTTVSMAVSMLSQLESLILALWLSLYFVLYD